MTDDAQSATDEFLNRIECHMSMGGRVDRDDLWTLLRLARLPHAKPHPADAVSVAARALADAADCFDLASAQELAFIDGDVFACDEFYNKFPRDDANARMRAWERAKDAAGKACEAVMDWHDAALERFRAAVEASK